MDHVENSSMTMSDSSEVWHPMRSQISSNLQRILRVLSGAAMTVDFNFQPLERAFGFQLRSIIWNQALGGLIYTSRVAILFIIFVLGFSPVIFQ